MKIEDIVLSLKTALKVSAVSIIDDVEYENRIDQIEALDLTKSAKKIQNHWNDNIDHKVITEVEDFLNSEKYAYYLKAISEIQGLLVTELKPYMDFFEEEKGVAH